MRSPLVVLLCLACPSYSQEDPVLKYSRQVPKVEFLHAISDGRGDVFVAGRTRDASLVVSRDAAQPRLAGGYDVVVAKFRGSDGEMVAATFLGGSGDDLPTGMALDRQGLVYVAGSTTSRNFPVSPAAIQRTNTNTAPTGFVAKLGPGLNAGVYSTYLGGTGGTRIAAIAADPGGGAYVTGVTDARDFVISPRAFRTASAPGTAFVARIDATGASIAASTFLGVGTPVGIAVALTGEVTVAGLTSSTGYPVTADAFQPSLSRAGSSDIFLTRLNPAFTGLVYSTYLGGSSNDQATAMAIDVSGAIYLSGVTYSDSFPGSRELLGTSGTGFVLKFAAGRPGWFHPFRANGISTVSSLELDPKGSVLAAGTTNATHLATTPDGYRRCAAPDSGGAPSPFYARIAPEGAIEYATYLHETVGGGSRWAVTLPGGDVISVSRLDSQFERMTNVVRRYDFSAAAPSRIGCIVGAASYRSHAIAPGMLITVFGSGLGPAEGVIASLDSGGKLPPSLAGVRVLVNDIPSPLLYVRKDQINAIVPFEMTVGNPARVRVESEGQPRALFTVDTKISDPGIFRLGASEFGVILNQDGTLNKPENPAERGSIITFWGTGLGLFENAYPNGSIVGADFSRLRLPARVSFLGVEGEVLYAGASPEMVAGVTQLNVRVPLNARVSPRVPIGIAVEGVIVESAYVSLK